MSDRRGFLAGLASVVASMVIGIYSPFRGRESNRKELKVRDVPMLHPGTVLPVTYYTPESIEVLQRNWFALCPHDVMVGSEGCVKFSHCVLTVGHEGDQCMSPISFATFSED